MKRVFLIGVCVFCCLLCGCSKNTTNAELHTLTVENAPSAPVCTPNLAKEVTGQTVSTTKALNN